MRYGSSERTNYIDIVYITRTNVLTPSPKKGTPNYVWEVVLTDFPFYEKETRPIIKIDKRKPEVTD